MLCKVAQHVLTHADQHRGAARRKVHPPQELLQPRFGSLVKLAGRFRPRLCGIAFDRLVDLLQVCAKALGQQQQELQPHVFGRGRILREKFAGQRHAGRFAALGKERLGHEAELVLG